MPEALIFSGPSPRAWGSRPRSLTRTTANRTIPTRVGITELLDRSDTAVVDHPHARGDHTTCGKSGARNNGPSPRAWGSHNAVRRSIIYHRTIPTRVGITCTCDTASRANTDHPHARGDHAERYARLEELLGPSPRAWGSHINSTRSKQKIRTIPTRVGITS